MAVADAVAARVETIKAEHPDVDLKLIDTSVTYTVGNYDAAMHTLYEGAALAVIVVFLFLRDLRATIIAAITLPLSILPAFWVMDMLGFSLNMVSLLAITLSTGILVDDAIVEIENIVRHMRMGKSPYQAALEAADEIGLAVIAISLTIVAIFVPASFMSSVPGQFFKQFGITVSVQVLFSLLCARLITPMLCGLFPQAAPAGTRRPDGPHHAPLHAAARAGRSATGSSPSPSACCCSSPRSRRRGCCRPAFCPPRIPRARCWRSSCRRARNSPTPRR